LNKFTRVEEILFPEGAAPARSGVRRSQQIPRGYTPPPCGRRAQLSPENEARSVGEGRARLGLADFAQLQAGSVLLHLPSLRERCAYHEAGHCVAALAYSIPVISVSIAADVPHLHRARYRAPRDLGLETLVTLCLSGPAAEELFCGSIDAGADKVDLRMAREYLSRHFVDPLRAGAELARHREAAQRLVRSAWATRHIRLLAGALMQRDTLTGEEIFGCVLAPPA
jgi:hypothetical protein